MILRVCICCFEVRQVGTYDEMISRDPKNFVFQDDQARKNCNNDNVYSGVVQSTNMP
jgi:hypothetical protein